MEHSGKMKRGGDDQRKSEGEGENRLLMVIWNIAPDLKAKTSFLGGLWGKGTIQKTKSLLPTGVGASPVQLLHSPELGSGEGFKPQLDPFTVFSKSLPLTFATVGDISGDISAFTGQTRVSL